MDKHSQSSDVFSDSGENYNALATNMDLDSYSALVSNTRMLLTKSIVNEVHKTNFHIQFNTILEDCEICISQSLNLVFNVLTNPSLQLERIREFMEDAVSLLRLLSGYIKNVVQSISMACCSFSAFPVTTGHIILTVFTYCKDSESLPGHHLKSVENQLKDLFKTCHDLQVTYLMILDRHFTFNLTNLKEMDTLLEALEMNLQIGRIVQTLDVKTMAEQWKGYTVLCEKYAAPLADKDVFYNCVTVLCSMTEENIRTAVEMDLEEKVTIRSLKVTSFTIKILLKVCNIFKRATVKNHDRILNLLIDVYLNSCSYLELSANKLPKFVDMMMANVLMPCEVLLKQLLLDETFLSTIFAFAMGSRKDDDKLLGYILLIMAVIKLVVRNNDNKVSKSDLIESVYKILPYGHIWFNMGLRFNIPAPAKTKQQTYGLYEHLLSHVYALATTLSGCEMSLLEERMLEALLGIDCYSALFTANLWSLVARITTPENVCSQMACLAKTCDELDNIAPKLWRQSPQRVHLNCLVKGLYETLDENNKHKVLRSIFSSLDSESGLSYCRNPVETVVIDFNKKIDTLFTSTADPKQIGTLIKTMRLLVDFHFQGNTKTMLAGNIVKAWTKACPNTNTPQNAVLDSESALHLEYLRSLAALTISFKLTSFSEVEQVKILHVASSLIQHGYTECKLALTNLFSEFISIKFTGENKHIAESILIQTSTHLLQEKGSLVKEKFCNILRILDVVEVVKDSIPGESIINTLAFIDKMNTAHLKLQFINSIYLKYVHKCLSEANQTNIEEPSDSHTAQVRVNTSNNFDLVDIDALFEVDSDSEPACKRAKLNPNELGEIIARLESETGKLCQVKENLFSEEHRNRVREVCVKLQGLIS